MLQGKISLIFSLIKAPVQELYRAVFLNRRDASRYQDLEAFLTGLELFLKPYKSRNLTLKKP